MTLNDVYEAFYMAKNCGYKIVAHMMPGLPQSSIKQDIDDFKKLFDDERLKPDMLKIYPTLVIKNTGLYKLYQEKKYNSYSTDDLGKNFSRNKKNNSTLDKNHENPTRNRNQEISYQVQK